MLNIQTYVRAKSLEEAYTLNQKRNARVLGGMLWLKMASNTVGTAIDLCELGLDTIEEDETGFTLGAMATLRMLEQHPGLAAYTQNAAAKAVQDIVGVQFRNMATVGGSVWGRFGFSDVLTLLLAADARVNLYKAGTLPIETFAVMPYDRDLLVSVTVPKYRDAAFAYKAMRIQRTDLPVLNCALARLDGEYRLAVGARPGKAVLLRDGALYLYYEGMSQLAGQSVTLLRDAAEGESGFHLTNYPALYAGDLQIDLIDGKIRPVLSVHVEDYLLGVVPYEMSDSFPLEALKAQAVAARTYALRSQNPTQSYDLVDTTNDQVYRGYVPGNDRTERAIRETRGVCGFYRDQLAQCYYSASNGGQTELVETVWPTDEDFGYYAFGDDPYDVANPDSVVRTFEMKKAYGEEETAPYALRSLLATQLFDQLTALGYDPTPESVRVDGVSAVSVSGAASEDNKYMTRLTLTVSISGRTRKNGGDAQ